MRLTSSWFVSECARFVKLYPVLFVDRQQMDMVRTCAEEYSYLFPKDNNNNNDGATGAAGAAANVLSGSGGGVDEVAVAKQHASQEAQLKVRVTCSCFWCTLSLFLRAQFSFDIIYFSTCLFFFWFIYSRN